MNPFTTPQEAKSYVVAKVVEQAMAEGVEITKFEHKLLDESVTEQEIEDFEERNDGQDAELFWHKIATLVRHGLDHEKRLGGRSAQRQYEAALELALKHGDYLAGIIAIEQLSTATLGSKLEHGAKRWLLLLLVCVFGGVGLAILLMFLFPALDRFEHTRTSRLLSDFVAQRAAPAFVVSVTVTYVCLIVTWLFSIVRRKLRRGN